MAESTTARLGLPRWTAGTDTPSRAEFDSAMSALEANAAMYAQGTRAARPAAGKAGRIYKVVGDSTAVYNGMAFYDDGTAWTLVGANVEDVIARASAAGTIPLIAKGAAGQTANLQEWRDSADAVKAHITPAGLAEFLGGLAVTGASALTGTLAVSGASTLAALSVTTLQTSGDVVANRIRSTAARADGAYKTEINADGTGRMDAVVPPGTVAWSLGASAPAGWLLLQGQAISRTTYADLFALIGTAFGAGDGSTTFNLPNVKGRMIVGQDTGQTEFDVLGETGGAKSVNLQHSHYTDHTHQIPDHKHDLSISTNASLGGSAIRDNASSTGYVNTGNFTTGGMNSRQYTDAALGVTGILPPYIVLTPMVKI